MKKNTLRKKLGVICLAMSCLCAVGCASEDEVDSVLEMDTALSEQVIETETSGAGIIDVEPIVEEETVTVEETNDAEKSEKMFQAFLEDEVTVTVGDQVCLGYDDYAAEHVGETMTLSELKELISDNEIHEDADPDIYYQIVSEEDESILFIKFDGVNIEIEGDDSATYFVIVRKGDELVITYSTNSWSRNDVTVMEKGIILESGSSGAGEYIVECGYIQVDGEYQQLLLVDGCYGGWFSGLFEKCPDIAFSEDTIELATKYGEESEYVIEFYYMNHNVYGYFEDSENMTELVEAAEADGLIVTDYDGLNEAITDHMNSYGISEEDLEAPIDWISL